MKKLVLGAAVVLAAGLANAENFYWTGASGGALSAAGNWAMESGAAATKAPGKGDAVFFTNDTAIAVTKGAAVDYKDWNFLGKGVDFNPNTDRFRFYGGGVMNAQGTGTVSFRHTLELQNKVSGQFAEGDVFTFNVGAGMTVSQQDTGSINLFSPATAVKTGAGTLSGYFSLTCTGILVLQEGKCNFVSSGNKEITLNDLRIAGSASKTVRMQALPLKVVKYTESADAEMTCLFSYYGNLRTLTLACSEDTRMTADLYAESAGLEVKWTPTVETAMLTYARRVLNQAQTKFTVSAGTLRFADGAGVRNLQVLNVASGARLEIAESASMMFSGAPVTLAEGAKLKVEGKTMVFKPKSLSYGGTAVPEGRYTGGDFDWLEGDGVLLVSSQPGGLSYYWAGDNGASFATVGNWRYANGTAAVGTPAKGDTIVFTNASDITVNKGCVGHVSDWNFLGKGVAFNPDTDRFYFYGGGVMNALGSGTVSMKHTFEFQNKVAGQFVAGDRFTFNIGPGMTVKQGGTGSVNLNSPATMVKTGAGTFAGSFNASCSGTLVVQEGICQISGSNNSEISLGGLFVEGSTAKTVRIDAHPQKISKYSEASDAEGTCLISYHGIERALTLACAEDTRMTADLYAESDNGILDVIWAPTDATATLTYAKRVLNQERTKFIVSAGTLKFAEGGGAKKLKGLSVSAGATLEIAADAYSDFADVPVTLAEGAKLKLDGPVTRLVRLSSLSVAGTTVPDGNYTKADYPAWLEGDAVLVVGDGETTAATWTGNGGGDTSIDNPANWGEVGATTLPDLTGGTLVATIPAGTTLSVPEGKPFALRGLVLQTTSDAGCTIGGAGSLGLGMDGLSITGGGTVTIDSTVELLLDQTWDLGSEASTRLVLETNAGIVGHGHEWTVSMSFADFKGNDGICVHIKCANPRLDDSSFNCGVHVSADGALGGPNAKVKINGGPRPRAALQMSACTLTNGKVTISNLSSGDNYRSIMTDSGACVIEGDCVVNASNGNYFSIGANAPLTVRGDCSGSLGINLVRMALPVFDGYDLTLEKSASLNKLNLEKAGVIRFEASSNVVRRGVFLSKAGALVVTPADEAFRFGTDQSSVAGVGFGVGGGTWDLAGTHQSLQMLAGVGRGVITSEDAATLVLDASKDYESDHSTKAEGAPTFNLKISDDAKTFSYVDVETAQLTDYVSFQGQVSFEKKGAKVHYQGGVSTSTGALTVSEGRLVFKSGAQWRTVSSVNVTGTGVLEVEGSGLLSSSTPIVVEGEETDRIVIPAGKTLKCASLSVNGVAVADGTVVTSGVVTGGGKLQVGKFGLVLIVR